MHMAQHWILVQLYLSAAELPGLTSFSAMRQATDAALGGRLKFAGSANAVHEF